MESLARPWCDRFPETPPCGHLLRNRGSHGLHWLRLHSLPGSKRYPEVEQDRQLLLSRHHDVLSELLGAGTQSLLCVQSYEEAGRTFPDPDEMAWTTRLSLRSCPALTWQNDGPEVASFTFFAAPVRWPDVDLDDLLLDVAEDRTGCVTILNTESGEIYAPYDGGMDLFLADAARRSDLRIRWRAWLSSHGKGL